jgi:hypothetical protein
LIVFFTLALTLRLPASASTQTVTLEQLGTPGDSTSRGARPSLTFYLPVFRSVRSVRFRAIVRISPAVDPHSTLTVSSGGTPQWSTSVESLRKRPVIDIPLPLPDPSVRTLDVSISGAFAHVDDDICSRFDPASLYFVVAQGSGFVVGLQPSTSTISGFLEVYGGDVAIVVPPGSSSERQDAAVRLAYQLEQLFRWRGARVQLRSSIDPKAQNVLLGDFKTDLSARGNVLEVGPKGVDLLRREIDPLLITAVVDAAQSSPSATATRGSYVSLTDLGLTTETQPGDAAAFSIPFNIGQVGGLPAGLRFVATLAHTALEGDDRATIELKINGALVDSLPLITKRGRQDVDFPIPAELVSSSNDVRLSVNYNTKHDCRAAEPTFTTTLFDDAHFQWDGITQYTPSVGDFFRSAAGRIAVLISDDQLVPYAFSLVATIGSGNANIKTLDVLAYDGTIPKNYDAVIVVAPLDRLSKLVLPLTQRGDGFALGDGAPRIVARYQDPFALLQTTRAGGVPVLVASYWKDASVTAGLGDFGYTQIAGQTDRVFMFRGSDALYASTGPRLRDLPQPLLLRAALPISGGAIAMLCGVIFIARRKRVGGRAV